MSRDKFYATTSCIVFRNNSVLVGQWTKKEGIPTTLTFPGGHVEHSDNSLELAAVRELKEEAGLDGLAIDVGPAYVFTKPGTKNARCVNVPVLLLVSDNQALVPNEEFESLWWQPITINRYGIASIGEIPNVVYSVSTNEILCGSWFSEVAQIAIRREE